MTRLSRLVAMTSILLLLCGCGELPSPTQSQTPAVPVPAPIPVKELAIGQRPKFILDAEVCDIHEFHKKHNKDGNWVCLEGTVLHIGSGMGAIFVNLACSQCGERVHCERIGLEEYRIPLNANVMVRGRADGGMLGRTEIVTQSQIDDAIRTETPPD
ncbi:MAG: hypothetical protein JWP89_6133 [Schlesneria sp.]|nr:hypothetical protein [Schlesneria sp.]